MRIHSDAVSALAAPDWSCPLGPLICSASFDGSLRLWPVGRLPLSLAEPDPSLFPLQLRSDSACSTGKAVGEQMRVLVSFMRVAVEL